MILTKEIKIDVTENLTSDYIECELQKLNMDVLSWAIVDIDDKFYTLNVSIVED